MTVSDTASNAGPPWGTTRTHVARDHAVIGPDSHVVAPLVGWTDTPGTVLIAPAMGGNGSPGFVQYLALLQEGSQGHAAPPDTQRFVYVLQGDTDISGQQLKQDGFVWLPPNHDHTISGAPGTRLWVHEQRYTPVDGQPTPEPVFGHAADVKAEPFMGDPAARLAKLLPQHAGFDLEVNRFTFDPGAALPLVESHVNEHGLLMLDGAGVYRLGSGSDTHWQPVQEGDAIWMGAFCPQWFACFGKQPATYLYSKNVNRSASA